MSELRESGSPCEGCEGVGFTIGAAGITPAGQSPPPCEGCGGTGVVHAAAGPSTNGPEAPVRANALALAELRSAVAGLGVAADALERARDHLADAAEVDHVAADVLARAVRHVAGEVDRVRLETKVREGRR